MPGPLLQLLLLVIEETVVGSGCKKSKINVLAAEATARPKMQYSMLGYLSAAGVYCNFSSVFVITRSPRYTL